MASFPTTKGGTLGMYGFQRSKEYRTEVFQFTDSSEQRWNSRVPLAKFVIVCINVNGYDVANIRQFFNDSKGGFDSTWDVTVKGVLYSNCCFADSTFPIAEPVGTNRFNLQIKVQQTI